MNLLVVSHACVTPINQAFFAAVERISGWQLTLVTPSRWKSEYGVRVASWLRTSANFRKLTVLCMRSATHKRAMNLTRA